MPPERIGNLSPSGLINGFYFLSATDADAWDRQSITTARQVIATLQAKQAGPQTTAAINTFNAFLQKVPQNQ